MQYVIKKHTVTPFDIGVYDAPAIRRINAVGYLADVDIDTLKYVTVSDKAMASEFFLYDAALLLSKLNKLNLCFYEIEQL